MTVGTAAHRPGGLRASSFDRPYLEAMSTRDGETTHEASGAPPDPVTDPVTDDGTGQRHQEVVDDTPRGSEWDERRAQLREAAIQAEYATGRHEDTEDEARRGVIRRVATIIVGSVVLLGGLAMMPLPGPGIPIVIAGLAILAQELPWAERLLESLKKRARIDELKKQPKWVQAVTWTLSGLAMAASLVYFTVIRT